METCNNRLTVVGPVKELDVPSVLGGKYVELLECAANRWVWQFETGTPYQHTDKEFTNILPQLLNSIEQVSELLEDDHWCAQEKFDGRRLIIRKQGTLIQGINKKGNLVGLPQPLFQVIHQYGSDLMMDGESIGNHYYAFDLLNLAGEDIRDWPYRQRLAALMNLVFGIQQRVIKFANTAFDTVPLSGSTQFYRTRSGTALTITSITISGGNVIITYN